MFKNLNTKQQGNIGLAAAIKYFTLKAYTVSLPLNDAQNYDLIVDINKALFRVQVKTTRCLSREGNYIVCLKSSGGTKGEMYHTLQDSECELLFILAEDGSEYLIPREVFIKNKTSISLTKNLIEYKL